MFSTMYLVNKDYQYSRIYRKTDIFTAQPGQLTRHTHPASAAVIIGNN